MQTPSRKDDFVELITVHRSRIFGYLLALLQNLADAEDLFQETSMVLWRKFDQFEPGTDFVQWACRTAQFEVLNFLRAKRRSHVAFSDELVEQLALTETPDWSLASERRTHLLACLEKLTPADRELVQRCYTDSPSIKHAAEHLGRSADTVYKALNRIRLALLKCINRAQAEGFEA